MVEPTQFFFNTETATDNEFMHKTEDDNESVNKKAIEEHRALSKAIQDAGVEVVTYYQQSEDLPDSLFPNNWFSTHKYPGLLDSRLICVYPMKAPTRQKEVNLKIVEDLSEESGKTIDFTGYTEKGGVLEGTGALIFDPVNRKVYANISQRCEADVLEHFLTSFNEISKEPIKAVTFESRTASDTPIYHTNVMLAILSDHAVVCLESIKNEDEREKVKQELTSSELNVHPRKLIDISLAEVDKMWGNVICVLNKSDEPCVIMSSTAFNGFTQEHKEELESHYKLIHADVSLIEKIGGGSARWMVAEVF